MHYLYAKALSDNDFSESIQFFEDQVEKKSNYETFKMLADLYFEMGDFNLCSVLCENLMKEVEYENNKTIVISLDILWIKSMIKLKKITWFQKVKALLRFNKYKKFILKNIGNKSPYYKELQIGKAMIMKLGQGL